VLLLFLIKNEASVKTFLILMVLVFNCTYARRENIWINYSIQYVGSEKELSEFVLGVTKNGFEYRVINHNEGVIEIQYREINKK